MLKSMQRIFSDFCGSGIQNQLEEQDLYLIERKRLETLDENIEQAQHSLNKDKNLSADDLETNAPLNQTHYKLLSPLRGLTRQEPFDPLRRHSKLLLDEMHFRFRSNPAVSDRRNAMNHATHRKSLMKGLLTITSKGETIPDSQLKEGKKIPIYMANGEYSLPENCCKPRKEIDSFYENETYVVLNKEGTIFRFNSSKSLFLFDQNNPLRCAAVQLFIAPLFAHFITFVILCNCLCMVMVEPPVWIDKYLEYLFTAIYITEAAIKIIARGFVLHSFSYLRDPWNWLDFVVIMTAIITEILKASFTHAMFSKVAVLRTFRVLRALKTMSTIPGLRAIVKALLRSIRALKDAVVLTIFCVSVFGLVGYQLFHGTLRQKCIREGGIESANLVPDALYFDHFALSNKNGAIYQSENLLFGNESRIRLLKNERLVLIYRNWLDNRSECVLKPSDSTNYNPIWSTRDAEFLKILIENTNASFAETTNESERSERKNWRQCIRIRSYNVSVQNISLYFLSRSFFKIKDGDEDEEWINFDPGGSNESTVNTKIFSEIANISCLHEFKINENITDTKFWYHMMQFGSTSVPRWLKRKFIVRFDFRSSTKSISNNFPFIYFTEMNLTEIKSRDLLASWVKEHGSYCKVEPKTGLFYYFDSPDRPTSEPIYCLKDTKNGCPSGYRCEEGGDNPDKGYTSFDHFPLAFLTSFRLVSLDAWSRLYYLTLHTAGPAYAVFYLLVVFLGSYYLVNLILAVVYMAYEEQQAVVDEEEEAAKEREEEERELKDCNDQSISSPPSDDDSTYNEAEPEVKLGLITTSLGPNLNTISRGSFYLRNRRRKVRHCSNPNMRIMPYEEFTYGNRENTREDHLNNIHHKRLCGVKSDTSEFIEGSSRGKMLNKYGTKLLRSGAAARRLSTPVVRIHPSGTDTLKNNLFSSLHVVPQLKMTPPSCNNITESYNVVIDDDKSVAIEDLSPSKRSNSNFPLIKHMGHLSESSSDDSGPCEHEKHVIVDVELGEGNSNSSLKESNPIIALRKSSCSNQKVKKFKKYLPTIQLHPASLSEEDNRVDNFVKGSGFDSKSTNREIKKNGKTFLPSVYILHESRNEEQNQSYVEENETFHLLFNGDNIEDTPNTLKKKEIKKKSRYQKLYIRFIDTFGKWRYLPKSLQPIQSKLREIVLNPFTDLVITICIALNALFLAIEHYPMDDEFKKKLENANLFFTIVFTFEMLAKICGLSPYTYFRERWNVFDAIVVLISLLEYLVQTTGGFSVLRAFRLMRIIKLAKQWPILNKLLRIIGRTLGKLSHLTLVFLIVLYIFAVVGMQLLHHYYEEVFKEKLPRWNFIDFWHAFMVVFRIQCGEWVENMFICLNVAHPGICIPLFVTVYIIGNLVILNLFLALLLNSFSGDVLQHTTSENNSISEAVKRVKNWLRQQKKKIGALPGMTFCQLLKGRFKSHPKEQASLAGDSITRDTEIIALREDKTIKLPCENGHRKTHKYQDRTGEHSSVFPTKESEFLLKVHNPIRGSPCSCRMASFRSSRSFSTNSAGSDWSSKSAPIHHARSVRHRRTRQIKDLARQRYRGMSCSIEWSKEDPMEPGSHLTFHHGFGAVDSKTIIDEEQEDKEDSEASKEEKKMEPCVPCIHNCCFDQEPFHRLRCIVYRIVKHNYFENVVIFCILLSSMALAMEDIYLRSNLVLQKVLKGIDIFCCIFFTVEMLLKWIGLGWKKYFTNYWCLLDCIIVVVSILNLSVDSVAQTNWSAFRSLRTFRALRPLRALSRFKGMKVVVDALIRAIPPILNVFMVCIVFWLIFGILGVNLFGGQFGRCVALPTWDILPLRIGPNETDGFRINLPETNFSLEEQCSRNNTQLLKYLQKNITRDQIEPARVLPAVRNKDECKMCASMLNTTDIIWNVPTINFDNVPMAYLALLQDNESNLAGIASLAQRVVGYNCAYTISYFEKSFQQNGIISRPHRSTFILATFNGWIEIMSSAVDATGVEEQPYHEASFYNYLYFCVFIIFGAFFSLNLFIGVIIDNFNQQKLRQKGGEDGVFLTDEQRRYYNAIKKMSTKKPRKAIPRPKNKFSNKVYDIVTHQRFEIAIMCLIIFNLVLMAVEHYGMSEWLDKLIQYLNLAFICIFLCEAILKLIGLRLYYFTIPWNVFDILVVIVSLISAALSDVMSQYFVQPTIFRIIRLFRVTRILRLVKNAKGIRTLLFALMMSLPALFNIGSLLFLLMSIYAIIGMSQFPYIQKISGIDDILNFETFPNAFLILFQMSTSEGWDKFIEPVLLDRYPYCNPKPSDGSPSNCGNSTVGIIFFVTYVIISFLIVVNMYIAVILENFEVATRESAEPLTADDFEQFFEVWQKYDDRLTQYIHYDQLRQLLTELEPPLRVPMPNGVFIANSQMKIAKDGKVHCLEVVISLIKKVLGDSPELNNLKDSMLESFMVKCKKDEDTKVDTLDSLDFTVLYHCAIKIQRAFRKYRAHKLLKEGYNENNDSNEVNSTRILNSKLSFEEKPG